eukprot:9449051-Alexandrium_andersonii.AAC.1
MIFASLVVGLEPVLASSASIDSGTTPPDRTPLGHSVVGAEMRDPSCSMRSVEIALANGNKAWL